MPNVLSSKRFKSANGFNMKFTNLCKAVVISSSLSAGALFLAVPTLVSSPQCKSLQDGASVEECMSVVQQNWYSWLQGKSRSTQFHFVDLLELLSRFSPASKP